jgi:hypothetical protein
MATKSALNKVKNRLHLWLVAGITDATFELDRPFDAEYDDAELATPHVNIRCARVQYMNGPDGRGDNSWYHQGDFMFDIATRSSTLSTIDFRQSDIAADIVARMAAMTGDDVGEIGELLRDYVPVEMGQPEDNGNLVDYGVNTLAYRLIWVTPRNDFRAISSATGAIIP